MDNPRTNASHIRLPTCCNTLARKPKLRMSPLLSFETRALGVACSMLVRPNSKCMQTTGGQYITVQTNAWHGGVVDTDFHGSVPGGRNWHSPLSAAARSAARHASRVGFVPRFGRIILREVAIRPIVQRAVPQQAATAAAAVAYTPTEYLIEFPATASWPQSQQDHDPERHESPAHSRHPP